MSTLNRTERSKLRREQNPFEKLTIFLPKTLSYMLREKSQETTIPMSRLVMYALDNELDAPNPFNYPVELPMCEFFDTAYASEAHSIATYLLKFPHGTGRDMLMLCRRDMDIPNRETFLLAYRELLNNEIIVEAVPPGKTKFNYADDYRYTKLRTVSNDAILARKKRKLAEMEQEIAEMEAGK